VKNFAWSLVKFASFGPKAYPVVELFRILVSRTELLSSAEESGCLVKQKRMTRKNLNLTRFMKLRRVETSGLLRLTRLI